MSRRGTVPMVLPPPERKGQRAFCDLYRKAGSKALEIVVHLTCEAEAGRWPTVRVLSDRFHCRYATAQALLDKEGEWYAFAHNLLGQHSTASASLAVAISEPSAPETRATEGNREQAPNHLTEKELPHDR